MDKIISAILFCILFANSSFANNLLIAIPSDVLEDYHQFVKDKNVLQTNDYKGEVARRDVVEAILVQQALYHGGVSESVNFKAIKVNRRILKELEKGELIMSATSMNSTDIEPFSHYLYISLPSVELGEFVAGLYTTPENTKALSAQTHPQIQALTAVSSKSWTPDWKALSSLKLAKLFSAPSWISMTRMVSIGRVDFLLAPFRNNSDYSFEVEGNKFIPIPNLKIALPVSRHFVISKAHPRGQEIHEAFNKGLKHLKNQGTLKKAYQDCGFFNARVASWITLNQL